MKDNPIVDSSIGSMGIPCVEGKVISVQVLGVGSSPYLRRSGTVREYPGNQRDDCLFNYLCLAHFVVKLVNHFARR
jgi:hypothetical protein